jgi:hypothetical protein
VEKVHKKIEKKELVKKKISKIKNLTLHKNDTKNNQK